MGKQARVTRHSTPEFMEDGEGVKKKEKHKNNSTNQRGKQHNNRNRIKARSNCKHKSKVIQQQ